VKETARYVTVEGDATISLPIIAAASGALMREPLAGEAETVQEG
jgi:deoxyhypusine synthase